MTNFGKSIIVTTATGVLALAGMSIQADACGLGDVDFKVTTDCLNVRTGPGTSYPVATKLNRGATVRPTELKDGWAKIGTNRWVSRGYITMIDNCTIPENGESYTEIEPTPYIINTNSLNIRREPSTNAKIDGAFTRGMKVFATKTHGKWLYATDGHNEGWINGGYTKKATNENNTTTQKPSSSIKEEKVTMRELTVKDTDSLNIRKGPGTNYAKTGTLKRGESVMSNVKSGNWYKIEIGEEPGWIHEKYVDVTIFSLNSNSTWDELLDPPAMDENDNFVAGPEYVKVSVPEGDKDGGLNVRLAPNLKGTIKTTLPNGTIIEKIFETSFGSYRIEYKNPISGAKEYGYVSSKYVVPVK